MKPDGTSTLGLGLPRVQLSNLKPTTDTELAQSIGNTSESYNMADHVGLVVYNTLDAPSCGMPAGLFVWDGEQWSQLSGAASTKLKGSYAEDVQALKDLYNANPSNTLGWNLSGDPAEFAGVTWATICGEKRVTQLNIGYRNLSSSTGIDKLYALTWLDCHDNLLTSLDVSGATALTHFLLYYNQLTTLDVSANTSLVELRCQANQLTSLNVSGATALTVLFCSFNQLTTLDVSTNTTLMVLDCSYNKLTQTEVNKFKLHPNYCPKIFDWNVAPQNGSSVSKPTCP
ncbi:hypothetical protein D0T66_15525 [Dysgonomonas sp. 25]|nr:hypothetical protein [Dysgonomonas sp. 25]